MNLSHKLFDVVEDEPIINPIIINLGPFKKLYEQDKSEDKSTYAKQLLYIWYLCDMTSPFVNSEDREEESMKYAFGKKVRITKSLQECIDEYKKRQSTPETRTLEKTIIMCDSMMADLSKSKNGVDEYKRLIDDINKLLKKLSSSPEDIERRIELMNQKILTADLVPRINKQLESLVDMRKKVQKSIIELDSESNKEAISNFIVDSFIDKYNN
jgi:hypothetical protein